MSAGNYSESILIPKATFEKLQQQGHEDGGVVNTEKRNLLGLETPAVQQQQHGGGGKQGKKTSKEKAAFLRYLNEKRRKVFGGFSRQQQDGNIANEEEAKKERLISIEKQFPHAERWKVSRLMTKVLGNPHKIDWVPGTYELVLNRRRYPGTNIVEILSFIFGLKGGRWETEDAVFTQGLARGLENADSVPTMTLEFVEAIEDLLPSGNLRNFVGVDSPRYIKLKLMDAEGGTDDDESYDSGPRHLPSYTGGELSGMEDTSGGEDDETDDIMEYSNYVVPTPQMKRTKRRESADESSIPVSDTTATTTTTSGASDTPYPKRLFSPLSASTPRRRTGWSSVQPSSSSQSTTFSPASSSGGRSFFSFHNSGGSGSSPSGGSGFSSSPARGTDGAAGGGGEGADKVWLSDDEGEDDEDVQRRRKKERKQKTAEAAALGELALDARLERRASTRTRKQPDRLGIQKS